MRGRSLPPSLPAPPSLSSRMPSPWPLSCWAWLLLDYLFLFPTLLFKCSLFKLFSFELSLNLHRIPLINMMVWTASARYVWFPIYMYIMWYTNTCTYILYTKYLTFLEHSVALCCTDDFRHSAYLVMDLKVLRNEDQEKMVGQWQLFICHSSTFK